MRVSEGEVINIHTMRRSDEEGLRKGGVYIYIDVTLMRHTS
jgi:hypothetical protein